MGPNRIYVELESCVCGVKLNRNLTGRDRDL